MTKPVPTSVLKPHGIEWDDFAKDVDLTAEQRKIALRSLRKLVSAIQIELPFVYVEKDGKRFYTLSAKQGAVVVDVVVVTPIPK